MKKGIIPYIETPTRKSFEISYGRISNDDWNTYGPEMAVWLAGCKYMENKIRKELLKKEKEKSKS